MARLSALHAALIAAGTSEQVAQAWLLHRVLTLFARALHLDTQSITEGMPALEGEPVLDAAGRSALAAVEDLGWAGVSPIVLGAALQASASATARHDGGEHYTTETDILKVLDPILLDGLREQLAAAGSDPATLAALHEMLTAVRVFDPACGAGNFLLVAYQQLRALEADLLHRLASSGAQAPHRRVSTAQCRGIEIEALPAALARTALAIAEAQADAREGHPAADPGRGPRILVGNALALDWATVCPIDAATVIVGNPPFLGGRQMSRIQKADQLRVWGKARGNGAADYVTNWFLLAARALSGTPARAGFVSTDSIAQGEQPSILWAALTGLGMGIDFAHRPFAWANDAGEQAIVRVVIVGFSDHRTRTPGPRTLTDYPAPATPATRTIPSINGYLLDGPEALITSRATPLPGGQRIAVGSQPTDGGHLAKIKPDVAASIRATDPIAARYLRPMIGAEELVHGTGRFCLWLPDATPTDLAASPTLTERTAAVRAMRLASTMASTVRDADTPHLFQAIRQPTDTYLAIPGHSTDNRPYLTTAFFAPDVIASNALLTITGATLTTFAVLSSRVFTAWNATVSGRLGAAYRVTPATTYNNFPWPDTDAAATTAVETAARGVLDARDRHAGIPLGSLYDPARMPADLAAAHTALDAAVLRAYGLPETASDADILAHLFTAHAALTTPAAENDPDDLALFAA